jgi:pimeloyl-ACP methyl ester carboxylesterase
MSLHSQNAVEYPYPVKYISLTIDRQPVRMAYMDISPRVSNGKTMVLLHGKNFNGFYWKNVIEFLGEAGYRVIVPDQVGWGKSNAPDIHYSFHLLAANTKQLLDSLHISKVSIIAHSMGGMLGIRFSLMYPQTVSKLILENPIGLEDYKTFVPYQSTDSLYQSELKATYESYLTYQKTYYPVWKPEYEPLVAAQAAALSNPKFEQIAWANALTYQMIYEQPVSYELYRISVPTLLIIGQEDKTIVGKNKLDKSSLSLYGQYPLLGRKAHAQIKNSKLVELDGVGHIPHIQVPDVFRDKVLSFLREQ